MILSFFIFVLKHGYMWVFGGWAWGGGGMGVPNGGHIMHFINVDLLGTQVPYRSVKRCGTQMLCVPDHFGCRSRPVCSRIHQHGNSWSGRLRVFQTSTGMGTVRRLRSKWHTPPHPSSHRHRNLCRTVCFSPATSLTAVQGCGLWKWGVVIAVALLVSIVPETEGGG